MSAKVTLPDPSRMADLLSDTLAKSVQVGPSAAAPASKGGVTAVYADDDGTPLGVCICELGLAACLGAALVRIPAPAVAEAIAGGTLSENLRENLIEVLNIAAQLFRPKAARHRVSLREIRLPGEALDEVIAEALKTPTSRMDIELTIPGYPKGKMSLATIDPETA